MIPNWCYATITDRPGIPKELLKPTFVIHEKSDRSNPLQTSYMFGIKWYRQIKGNLRQFGSVTRLDRKRSQSVIEFVKQRWLEDIDTFDRAFDRWNWIPFFGPKILAYVTRDLFRFPSI